MLQNQEMFAVGQVRLAELSVYNWGSFNGLHSAKIDRFGTLITGDNGSGKSTFIDGLMALLLPAGKATFNVAAAQGDRTDRSLLSYMRGSFGTEHDGTSVRTKSKRESAVVTGLRALYRGDDGSEFTLTALFWTTQSSNALADVKKVYAVAKRNVNLKELLDAFGDGNARALKQFLRDDPAIECCDDHFGEYQTLYRKLLHMENKNAPALLSRALGLKKIDDLTGLIRDLVLEPSSIKQDARKVVDEFADLVAIHNELTDARAQQQHLSRLPELNKQLTALGTTIASLQDQQAALPVFMAEILVKLWQQKIKQLEQTLQEIVLLIAEKERQEIDANEAVEQAHKNYLELGGNRIEELKKQIESYKTQLKTLNKTASKYQETARALELSAELLRTSFAQNQQIAETSLKTKDEQKRRAQEAYAETSGHYSHQLQTFKELESEIAEIKKRPESNIDIRFQQLRDELVETLNLDKDRCKFLGELMDVKPEERHWQGAIERALGGLRTTLAVPQESFSMVTKWLNARHTGLHVRVQVVRDFKAKTRPPEFKTDGFLRKLQWREHPFREWLKQHLSRFDLYCVDSTDSLDKTPFSMTQQGLIHKENGRFEKKDIHRVEDRRQWFLGFSNQSRLALLESEHQQNEKVLVNTFKQVEAARHALDNLTDRFKRLESIVELSWDEIDVPYWQQKLQASEAELFRLEQQDHELENAEQQWEKAKLKRKTIQDEKQILSNRQALQINELRKANQNLDAEQQKARQVIDTAIRMALEQRKIQLTLDNLSLAPEIQRQQEHHLQNEVDKAQKSHSTAENTAIGIMSSFRGKDKWLPMTVDWPTGLAGLGDFLGHLAKIEREGLPALVEKFTERLTKHTTQSLAQIHNKLESEKDEIGERIDKINQVLKRTEFRTGSFLRLGWINEKYPHVQAFEKDLRAVLSQINSDDHEARYQQICNVIEVLAKASSSQSSTTLESLRLLEPRYQMSFFAEEVVAQSGEVKDVLRSSTGKSGGEKESFAGIVVAASLSYVLTPEGYDHPIFCTVFLDEAFSNTAESVSRRVLQVFKELDIHVNLITPYKNLNLARDSARSLLIAERDADRHESHLIEVTWQEIDEKLQARRQTRLEHEMEELGIEV